MDKGHMAGLIEGEGCFRIKHVGNHYSPEFSLTLRDDDKIILEELKSTLNVHVKLQHAPKRGNHNPTVRLQLSGSSGCMNLIDFLDNNPFIGKKREQYTVWKEAVHYHRRNRRTGAFFPEKERQKKAQMQRYFNVLQILKEYSR